MTVEKPKLDNVKRVPFSKKQKVEIKIASKKAGFKSMSSFVRWLVTIDLKEKGYLDDED